MTEIPFVLCLDVEPDPREPDPTRRPAWKGFEALYPFIGGLRERLQEVTRSEVQFSWFFRLDPSVEKVYGTAAWPLEQYGEWVSELQEVGDEIGIHAHAARWDEAQGRWIHDYADEEWSRRCLAKAFEAFRGAMGRGCDSFRAGDHLMSNAMIRQLEEQGVRFDLTLEPGEGVRRSILRSEKTAGRLPDYTRVPRAPFRPSVADFRRPAGDGGRKIWMIPLSAANRPLRKFPYRGLVKRLKGLFRPVPAGYGTARLWDHPETGIGAAAAELPDLAHPYLAFAIRSDLPAWRQGFDNFRANFELLQGHPQADRLRFRTPAAALEVLGLS